jgi:hypothetical protein
MAFDPDTSLYLYRRPALDDDIPVLHERTMENFKQLPPPFGIDGMVIPPVPVFKEWEIAVYSLRYPYKKFKCLSDYWRRITRYQEDRAMYDEVMRYHFYRHKLSFDYKAMCHEYGKGLVKAYAAYRMALNVEASHQYMGSTDWDYNLGKEIFENKIYERLLKNPTIDVNGRNNIYTLNVVQYWDALLCEKALGYGPEEVVRRLTGLVPRVERWLDGVYVVFSDDPHITYETFEAYNNHLKPILGLV